MSRRSLIYCGWLFCILLGWTGFLYAQTPSTSETNHTPPQGEPKSKKPDDKPTAKPSKKSKANPTKARPKKPTKKVKKRSGQSRKSNKKTTPKKSNKKKSHKKKSSKKRARKKTWNPTPAALKGLEPAFRVKVEAVLKELQENGWQPVVVSGKRSKKQQKKILAAGRSRTMKSLHLCGRAADLMDRRYGWKGEAASPKFAFWQALGIAARRQGLVWGGDWKSFQDVPHIQTKKKCGVR